VTCLIGTYLHLCPCLYAAWTELGRHRLERPRDAAADSGTSTAMEIIMTEPEDVEGMPPVDGARENVLFDNDDVDVGETPPDADPTEEPDLTEEELVAIRASQADPSTPPADAEVG
jgi:hypothetical protein